LRRECASLQSRSADAFPCAIIHPGTALKGFSFSFFCGWSFLGQCLSAVLAPRGSLLKGLTPAVFSDDLATVRGRFPMSHSTGFWENLPLLNEVLSPSPLLPWCFFPPRSGAFAALVFLPMTQSCIFPSTAFSSLACFSQLSASLTTFSFSRAYAPAKS